MAQQWQTTLGPCPNRRCLSEWRWIGREAKCGSWKAFGELDENVLLQWSRFGEDRGMAPISWDVVCKPVNQKKPGVLILQTMNLILLTNKFCGQDYKFCGRIGFESLMRLLWHVTGLGDFHGLYSRSKCIMEWLEAYFSRVGEYFVAKLGNDIKLCYWLDDS